MPRTVDLLVNPTAGRGRAARLVEPATAILAAGGCHVRQRAGRNAVEALDLAHAAVAGGTDALVVLGGDGAVALGLQAVAGTPTPLGIVPAGTGNDIARAVGLPHGDPLAGAAAVVTGSTRTVDLGRCRTATDERWFAGVLATGFDSRVNERANALRWPRGRARYHLAMITELELAAIQYEITVDGLKLDVTATLVAVGNGPSYGGGMRIAPSADLHDGRLDVTVITRVGRARLLRIFPEVYPGRFVRWTEYVQLYQARTVELAAPGVIAYADGERIGPLPIRAEAVPGALHVLAPPPLGRASRASRVDA